MELEEEVKSLSDYLQMIRRRKYLIAMPMLLLLIISAVVALVLPPVYRSEATVLIEQQHIPTDLVQSTVVSLADERIRQIEQRIMTINQINKIIGKYKLYADQRNKLSSTDLANEFRENTLLTLISADLVGRGRNKATLAFKIAFDHRNPIVAQKVANEIVTLYLDENIKNRTARALETTTFLDEEARKFKLQVQKIENQIAEYKAKYSDSLPELLAVNVASISRVESGLQQLALQGQMLNERLISLRNQLAMTSPTIEFYGANSDAPETLASLKARYKNLLGIYSEAHPNVIATKRKIDEWDKSETSDDATNPVYIQIKSEIHMAVIQLQSMQGERKKLQASLEHLENSVSQTHQVERGYHELMRDLDNNRAKYQELKAKALEARLSQTLEEEQKAEKFSLLEPARVPDKPEKPNRLKILIMGFALSVGVGFGAGFVAEMIDGSIRGHRALERVTGSEPLVIIPYIQIQDDLDRSRKNKRNFIIITVILIIGGIAALHFLYKPLDLLWFKIWHKISML